MFSLATRQLARLPTIHLGTDLGGDRKAWEGKSSLADVTRAEGGGINSSPALGIIHFPFSVIHSRGPGAQRLALSRSP